MSVIRASSIGLCLVALFACAGAIAQEQAARPFLGGYLQESRVVYPLRVGAWEAMGEHRYDEPELGVSVRYRDAAHPDRWMDLYFYPSGVLLDPQFSRVFDDEIKQIREVHRQRNDATLEATPSRSFAGPVADAGLLGELAVRPRSAAFAFGDDGKRYHSALAMTVVGMYFVKVRFSAEAEAMALDAVRSEGEGFLSGFAGSVRTHSTGDCWRTLPVLPIPADGRKPDDIMASANDGTDGEIWIAEDRLYVAQAAFADETRRAAPVALGTALHGALRGRCIAPEKMDMEVPEGMREIRFEYRSPSRPGERPQSRVPTRAQG